MQPRVLSDRPIQSPSPALLRPESALSGSEPAPLGIGDLGGSSAGAQPGTFSTTAFQGSIYVGSVSAYNSSITGYEYSMSFQLNAFLLFQVNGAAYSYWVQDVVLLETQTRQVNFEDNVWNVTSVDIAPTALKGNGSVSGSGSESYYSDGAPCTTAGACISLPNPSTVVLRLDATLGAGGVPTVREQFRDGGPLETYDTIEFPFAHSQSEFHGFEVERGLGFPGGCPRCYGDVELVAGGPGYGYQTSLDGTTDLLLSLDWWNGHNLEPVPNAVDYGVATEEGLSNALVARGSNAAEEPVASLSYGIGGGLGSLWSEDELSAVEVSLVGGASGGNLSVEGSGIPYEGWFVETLLLPGSYSLAAGNGSSTHSFGSLDLIAGEALTLEAGGIPLQFVPEGLPPGTVWSVSVGGQQLNGTGNITFGEVAGTYSYSVGPLSGYSASPDGGSVSPTGAGTAVTVDWKSTPTTLWGQIGSYLAPWLPLLVFLLVAVVAIVVASTMLSHRRSGGGGY